MMYIYIPYNICIYCICIYQVNIPGRVLALLGVVCYESSRWAGYVHFPQVWPQQSHLTAFNTITRSNSPSMGMGLGLLGLPGILSRINQRAGTCKFSPSEKGETSINYHSFFRVPSH